jgi:hypothetical protein
MTKKPEPLALEPTQEGLSLFKRELDSDAMYVRVDALEKAITFHKNNGGMTQPQQVVSTATVFLDFITGENK